MTTHEDFLAMDETLRPSFSDGAAGHRSKRRPQPVLDIADADTIEPPPGQYCKESLTESAYPHAMQAGIAFEPAAHTAAVGHARAAADAKPQGAAAARRALPSGAPYGADARRAQGAAA